MKRACTAALILVLCGCNPFPLFRLETVVVVETGSSPAVVFDVPVPEAPAVLQAFELSTPAVHPGLLGTVGWKDNGQCRFRITGDDPKPSPAPRRVLKMATSVKPDYAEPARRAERCQVNNETGEVELYPDFAMASESKNAPLALDKIRETAGKILTSTEVLPEDELKGATIAQLDRQIIVRHQQAKRQPGAAPQSSPSQSSFVYNTLARRVGQYPVDGPGSRLAYAVDGGGNPQAFIRGWRPVSRTSDVTAKYNAKQVRAEIERQLLAARPRTTLHVRSIELVYYDGNAKLLQPVYRYVVEETQSAQGLGSAEHIIGFLRYGDTAEPVPELSDLHGKQHVIEKLSEVVPGSQPLLLGAYVARRDNHGWAKNARDFLQALGTSTVIGPLDISQLSAAYPYQFTDDSADYVNSVNLALVEGHGAPWTFATEGDCCDRVSIGPDSEGKPGAVQLGGTLRHLVLHSCKVVASPDDERDWARPWWDSFKGVTSVVGYRTSMYINDGAGAIFGRSLANGASVLGAWFNSVASLNAYARDSSLRFRCGGDQPMGRPAAISVCGTEDVPLDRISTISENSPPTCLDAWWIGDAVTQ